MGEGRGIRYRKRMVVVHATGRTVTVVAKSDNWPPWAGGGESGIRTRVKLFTPTRFPGVRLKPLGHLSRAGMQR